MKGPHPMKMAELSRRSGAPVATIKYYIREGLLPAGTRTARNQADYGTAHVERIELIRALRDVAGLPIATIKQTLDAVDGPPADAPDHLTVALSALSTPLQVPAGEEADYQQAAERVDAVITRLGWKTDRDAVARSDLIRAVVAIHRHFPDGIDDDELERYALVAQELAAFEIPDTWDPVGEPTDALRYAVLGTVLFEPVILALRRLAHVDRHRRLAGGG